MALTCSLALHPGTPLIHPDAGTALGPRPSTRIVSARRPVFVRAMGDLTYKEKAGTIPTPPKALRRCMTLEPYPTLQNTSVEYPMVQQFWWGEKFRCLGAGARAKKVVLFNVNVYSVGLYVEVIRAAKQASQQ